MQKLIKMPSIQQFAGVIRDIKHQAQYVGQDENDEPIYDPLAKMPKVKFTGTTKLHGCFEKNTKITLANGENIPISKITEGTYILTFDIDNDVQQINKVTKVLNQKLKKEWCKLIFDKTEIICTKDHKFWTINRGWVEAKDLLVDDVFEEIN